MGQPAMVESAIIYAVTASFFVWKSIVYHTLRWPLMAIGLHLYVIVLRRLLESLGIWLWMPWGDVHVWTMRGVALICIVHFLVARWLAWRLSR